MTASTGNSSVSRLCAGQSGLDLLRLGLGAAALVAASLFPFASQPLAAMELKLFGTGALALAALAWGFAPASRWFAFAWLAACALALAHRGPYLAEGLFALGAFTLALLAVHTGARLRTAGAALDAFLAGVIAAAALNAIEGLLQYFGLGWHLYPWVVESLQRGVAFGAFRQPNILATLLVFGIVCTAWAVARRLVTASMAWAICTVLEFGLAASTSRVGLLALVTTAVAALAMRERGPAQRLLLLQPLLYGAFALLLPWLADLHGIEGRLLADRISRIGTDSRWILWSNTLEMIWQRPWLGWGWDEFGYAHYEVPLAPRFGDGTELLDNAHNLPLHLATVWGLPLALLATAALAACVWRAWRELRAPAGVPYPALLLLVIGLHSLLELPLWWPVHLFIAGVATGHAWGGAPAAAGRRLLPRALALAGVLLAAGAAVGYAQYQRVVAIYATPARLQQARAAAIERASGALLFEGDVDYARLLQQRAEPARAAEVGALADRLLHFAAEPAVISRRIEAAWLAGRRDEARHHALRFRHAHATAYRHWLERMRSEHAPLAAWLAAAEPPKAD